MLFFKAYSIFAVNNDKVITFTLSWLFSLQETFNLLRFMFLKSQQRLILVLKPLAILSA